MFNFLMAPVILLKLDQKRNSHRVDALSFMFEFQTFLARVTWVLVKMKLENKCQWCSFVEFWKTNHERKWQMECGDRGIWYLWKSKNLKNALLNMREDGKWNVAFGGYGTCGN